MIRVRRWGVKHILERAVEVSTIAMIQVLDPLFFIEITVSVAFLLIAKRHLRTYEYSFAK